VRSADVYCSQCGKEAARFEFAPLPDDSARGVLKRVGFLGTVSRFLTSECGERQLIAVLTGALPELSAAEPDLCGFFCRQCAASYCQSCWTLGALEFDEGFYDCQRAICPKGHEQVVDD
jgi:hypothetical protein